MKITYLSIISLVFLLLSVSVSSQNKSSQYQEGEILVQLNNPFAIGKLISDYNAFGLQKKHIVSKRFNIYLLKFDDSRTSNQSMIQAINLEKDVLNVQNNHRIKLRDTEETLPNDSLFNFQWSMYNTGEGGGVFDADIDATDAWDITTGGLTAEGDTIVVAIIDGGSDIYHEDLDHWVNFKEIPGNNIDDDTNGYIDDRYGWNAFDHNGDIPFHQHGTHVAGIAGARGNNTKGVAGVNWNVKILPVAGGSSQESTVVEALSYVYVVRERYNQTNGEEGAFVVVDNCSFGVNQGQPEDYPIWEAMYDSLGELGILSIGATANNNWDIDEVGDIPTAFSTPYMIAVTNTTFKDEKNTGAAYGDTTIDLGAPGTNIRSTLINNKYGNKTGTSMATPHVAGAVAFLMSAADSSFIAEYKNNPSESILQIREHILNGVDLLDDLQGKTVTGGRLNLFNSLNLLLNAPFLSADKDTVYKELVLDTEGYESLVLSNIGGDTINYSITVEGSPTWVELNQYEGSLPSLEEDEISLTFYSNGLDTGTYQTTLVISAENIITKYIPVIMVIYDNVGISTPMINNALIRIFPNPFMSELNISFSDDLDGRFDVQIYDQSGKMVFSEYLEAVSKPFTIVWETGTTGIFYYRISQNGQSIKTGKIIRL